MDASAGRVEIMLGALAMEPEAAPRGRQVIGAHQWNEDESDEMVSENTQVIESVDPVSLEAPSLGDGLIRDPLATARKDEAPAAPAPSMIVSPPSADATDDDDEEEFGNTQIIPSLTELDTLGCEPTMQIGDEDEVEEPSPSPKKKSTAPSSQDLMDELEDLIGKKVDELIQ